MTPKMKSPAFTRLSEYTLHDGGWACMVFTSKQFTVAETNQVYTISIKSRKPIALSNRHLLCVVIKLTTTVLFDFSNDCAGWLRRRWMKTIPEKRLSSPSNDDTLMRILGSPVDFIGLTAKGLSYSSSLCVRVKSKDKDNGQKD